LERASALADEALALQREMNDTVGVTRSLLILGLAATAQHDYERAMTLHEESLARAREAKDGFATTLSLALGAYIYLNQGNQLQTRVLCKEGLKLSQQLGMPHLTAAHLHAAACLAGARGQAVRSARLWGAAYSLREEIGTILSPVEREVYGPNIDAAHALLDETTWEATWAVGKEMSLEEAIDYALSEDVVGTRAPPAPDETPATLTRREQEVAVLVARRLTNRQIATALVISERTVDAHVANILKKLNVHSREQITSRLDDY